MSPDDDMLDRPARREADHEDAPPLLTPAGRALRVLYRYRTTGEAFDRIEPAMVATGGEVESHEPLLVTRFDGEAGSFQVQIDMEQARPVTGAGARLRLSGWDAVRYVAVGVQDGKTFRHVKAPNPPQDQWFELAFDVADLALAIQTDFDPAGPIDARIVKVYVSGTPSAEGSVVAASDVFAWQAAEIVTRADLPEVVDDAALDAILDYWQKAAPAWRAQAADYFATGGCPMNAGKILEWPLDAARPPAMADNKTHRYSWHAGYPALVLLMEALQGEEPEAFGAARGWVTDWLGASYDTPDEDKKYTWYDHGVAERLLVLVVLLAAQRRRGRDLRFEARLFAVITAHARLLASEAFYAGHQRTRYHNHAWFQDIALLATAAVLPDLPGAQAWSEIGRARLNDQFERLIVRDGGFAVFVENSIGYHAGVVRLVRFAGELSAAAGEETGFEALADELDAFTRFFRYADGRAMAQGDTFRRPNPTEPGTATTRPIEPGLTVLPRAGYAVAKGHHGDDPFVLCLVATSLNTTHKHEDNLAFGLHLDGVEWLCDPSFYSHAYDDPIPSYLRSAAAHNVARVAGPYSVEPGTATLAGSADGEAFLVEGSTSSMEGIRYDRRLAGRLDRLDLRFTERLVRADGEGAVPNGRLAFQLGDGVRAAQTETGFVLTHPASSLRLALTLGERAGGSERIVDARGQDGGPIGGIAGLGFMQVIPAETIDVPLPPDGTLDWSIRAA